MDRYIFTDPCTLSSPIEFRNTEQHFCRNIFVHDPKHNGGCGGVKKVKENQQPVVQHGGRCEATIELIPEEQVDIGLDRAVRRHKSCFDDRGANFAEEAEETCTAAQLL